MNNLPNEINIVWCIEDIKSIDEQRENDLIEPLTDDECRRVLNAIKINYDATIGVNWEVIEVWIDEIRSQRKEKEVTKSKNLVI